MLIDEIVNKHPTLKVIKTYPESGQKWVYLVEIEDYGKVMLKIIKQMDDRIRREIDIVNNNDIPGVPRVIETSSFQYNQEDHYYIIEEFIDGQTLKEKLSSGPLDLSHLLKLLEDLLTVVVKLEKIGIVHRDIKPDNIICAADGSYHLIDFGIARNLNLSSLTFTAAVVGPHTPGYGAPELFQYDKAKINSRADLFSIGVVTYEAIFGRHPFVTGKEVDYNEIWYRTVTVMPKAEMIPGDTDSQLMGFILTLMQKQVSKRPPSAEKAFEWYQAVKSTVML